MPFAEGTNATVTVQLWPGWSLPIAEDVVVQVSVSSLKSPVTWKYEYPKVLCDAPMFVRVNVLVTAGAPIGSEPKLTGAVVNTTFPGARPVPVSETVWGDDAALSLMIIVALLGPTPVGSKFTYRVQGA